MDPELAALAIIIIFLQGFCTLYHQRISANLRPIADKIGNGGIGSSGFTGTQAEAIQMSLAEIEAILADAADELPEIFANLGENDGSAPSPAPMFAQNNPLISSIAPLILHKLMAPPDGPTSSERTIRQEQADYPPQESHSSPEATPEGQGNPTD